MTPTSAAAVDLYWIPLGAGGHSVRFNGRVFEAVAAMRQRRPRCDLYHAALVVASDGDRFTIEIAPSPDADEASRGVVATGPVGSRRVGWWRLFRYEVRCWRDGRIPDLDEAVNSPQTLSRDTRMARRVLDLLPEFPRRTWGADEQQTGDMWNSNSLVSWLLARSGHDLTAVTPPAGGRAPGWSAGMVVAEREASADHAPTSVVVTSSQDSLARGTLRTKRRAKSPT